MFILDSKESMVCQLAGTKSFPVTDYKTKEPKVDPETGEPQWQFSIMVPTEYRFEQFPVKVFSKEDPIAGAVMGDSVELSGVAVDLGYLSGDNGGNRQFWRIRAESVLVKKQKA